ASAVLDDELVAETLREPLCHHARNDVGGAPGGKADDDAHRPRRIGFRPRETRGGRQRGSARGQVQKISAEKVHLDPSPLWSLYSITWSARASSMGGPVRPSALAVVRSMTRSNFVEARRMRVFYPSRPSARMVSCTFGLAPIRAMYALMFGHFARSILWILVQLSTVIRYASATVYLSP